MSGGRPKIGPEIAPGNNPGSGLLDTDGEPGAARVSTPEDCMKVGIVAVQDSSEGENVGNTTPEISHAGSMGLNPALRKRKPHIRKQKRVKHWGMASDVYPYRPNFRDAVKTLRVERKISLGEVAKLLGLELDTLHDYLYKHHQKPGREPLKALARLTGRPMADFDDDPGAPPEGTNSDSSEMDRFMLRVMGSDVSKLTEAQKQSAFDAWRAIIRGLIPPK